MAALRDELERSLRASWHTADLAVYAECFNEIGDDTDWSYLEQLVQFLESLQAASARVVFRVAWGF